MTPPLRRSPVAGMRRGLLLAGLAAAVLAGLGGALVGGTEGALSALAGSLLVLAVLLLGLVAMSLVVRDAPTSMAGAFVVYLGQLLLLIAGLIALRSAPWLRGEIAAASGALTTLLLQAGQITGYVRSRHVLYPEGRA